MRRIIIPQSLIPALRDGRKTQHRVPVRPQPPDGETVAYGMYHPTLVDRHGEEYPGPATFGCFTPDGDWALPCPFPVGSEFWVAETWQAVHFTDDDWWHCKGPVPEPIIENPETPHPPFWAIVYQQDPEPQWEEHIDDRGFPWRSPATMPRWASRFVLTITDVRVERVGDTGHRGCVAEGWPGDDEKRAMIEVLGDGDDACIEWYADYWDATHGPGAWTRNDYVWVPTFTVKETTR